MVYRFLIACTFFSPVARTAQLSPIDSLKQVLRNEVNDSLKVVACYHLMHRFIDNNIDSAAYYSEAGLLYARKTSGNTPLAIAHNILGEVCAAKSDYENMIIHNDSTLYYCQRMVDGPLKSQFISTSYSNLGIAYKNLGEYRTSIDYYLQGLKINEENESVYGIAVSSANIGNLYAELEDHEKSKLYLRKALRLFQELELENEVALLYNNLATEFDFQKEYDSAFFFLQKSLAINQRLNNKSEISRNFTNLGTLVAEREQSAAANKYFLDALAIRQELDDRYGESETLSSLAKLNIVQGNEKKGLEYFHRALTIAREIKAPFLIQNHYKAMSEAYEKTKSYHKANTYLVRHFEIKDSLLMNERAEKIHQLNIKYESEKKDRELAEQQTEILKHESDLASQKQINIFAAIVGAGLIAVLVLVIRNNKVKRTANEEKVKTLEKENELKIVNAMLAGEEKERNRIAKELHDGVAASIAAIKIKLSHSSEGIAEAIDLLDSTGKEIRDISHNLMPGVLLKQGLIEALNSYLAQIQSGGDHEVSFHVKGLEERLNPNLELTIYRIIQELVSNIVKHAGATEIDVQITRNTHILTITVEDNGKGMNEFVETDGMGLEGIRNRLDYIDGKLDIESGEHEGTSVYIEIHLQKAE